MADVAQYQTSPSLGKLSAEVAASGTVAGFDGLRCAGGTVFVMGTSLLDPNGLDAVVSAHVPYDLSDAKADRTVEVDARTAALIQLGFTYAGLVFSLSLEAQSRLTAAHHLRDNPALTYPVTWSSLDDSGSVDLAGAAALDDFYLTAVGTIRAHIDSGTALKIQIRDAVDQAALDAIVDTR